MSTVLSTIGREAREMVSEQIAYRELLYQLTRRDLLLRYKQTAMGVAWAVFTPLVNTILFWAVFTRVAPMQTTTPYVLYAYIGLAAWNFSASALRFAAVSLTSNVTLVTKVYCPREIFPVSAVAVALVDFAVASLLLVPLLAWYGMPATTALAVVPGIVLIQAALTAAIALLLSMANLFYRDIKYLFEVVLTVWMFASSVVYPVERFGGRIASALRANPMAVLIDAYRATLLEGRAPDPVPLALTGLASLLLLAISWAVFHRAEFAFAEQV